jgi:hypothetical protein
MVIYDRRMKRAVLAVALLLPGCSFSYPMEAMFVDGRLAFDAKRHSSGCIDYFEITNSSGQTMWRVEGKYQYPECKSSLPVVYGVVPHDTEQTAPLRHLRAGERYYIAGNDGDSYYGSFKLREVVAIDNDVEAGRSPPQANGSFNELAQPVGNGS